MRPSVSARHPTLGFGQPLRRDVELGGEPTDLVALLEAERSREVAGTDPACLLAEKAHWPTDHPVAETGRNETADRDDQPRRQHVLDYAGADECPRRARRFRELERRGPSRRRQHRHVGVATVAIRTVPDERHLPSRRRALRSETAPSRRRRPCRSRRPTAPRVSASGRRAPHGRSCSRPRAHAPRPRSSTPLARRRERPSDDALVLRLVDLEQRHLACTRASVLTTITAAIPTISPMLNLRASLMSA